MKIIKYVISIIITLILSYLDSFGQAKVDKYWEFIEQNQNYSIEKFYNQHPVGLYKSKTANTQSEPLFLDSIKYHFELSNYELQLINKHDFMVTERVNYQFCWDAFADIWHKDLPLMITTDAVLDAFHVSYDAILRNIEISLIIPKLRELLSEMHNNLQYMSDNYSSFTGMKEKIDDLDVYLSIARTLLDDTTIAPVFAENSLEINKIIDLIEGEQAISYPLFSSTVKKLDFSQFTPRGHYTLSDELKAYFKTMIWLGRTEFYLIAPEEDDNQPKQTPEDIQRQTIDVILIHQLIEDNNLTNNFSSIDKIIESMVGFSDNVQLSHIGELLEEMNISSPVELLDMNKLELFQELLSSKEYAEQKILSQILMSNPFDQKQIKPASAFMLFGQRFLIDSYVSGNLVYDKIIYDNKKIRRMLPSSFDVLFSLGNNAAGDFLQRELEEYKYSKNLAALRLLIDSYDNDYWSNSIYSSWLNAIRTLNSPTDEERNSYPAFMQTAAWWQEKMNTQLASWAQLRRDNILYGKQSYTGGISCSNPYVYLEPIPKFYSVMSELAKNSLRLLTPHFDSIDDDNKYLGNMIKEYLHSFDSVCMQLEIIAEKELSNSELTENEKQFLLGAYSFDGICGTVFPSGWLGKLYFNADLIGEIKENIVADIHTSPTDQAGNKVGWVKHVGTGPVNLGIFIVDNRDGKQIAYAGPVLSYYEFTSLNFKRLNDDEWIEQFGKDSEIFSMRPNFVDLYLADKDGNSRNDNPPSLPVLISEVNERIEINSIKLTSSPNPFSENTKIGFVLPEGMAYDIIKIKIYDINGNSLKELFSDELPAGNYSVNWDGTDNYGNRLPSAMYIYQVEIGNEVFSGKVILK